MECRQEQERLRPLDSGPLPVGVSMSVVRDHAEPLAIVFEDDGLVPNNILPFLVYQSAVKLDPKHPEATIEDLFEGNGWGGTWRNGVYDYLHYHATVHEVLGVA
jgi:uncharacterized protein YjlB